MKVEIESIVCNWADEIPYILVRVINAITLSANKEELRTAGKATLLCPFWANRIAHFGHNMIDPFGQNNINHLVQVSSEFFLCRFETPSPGVRGNNKIYSNE